MDDVMLNKPMHVQLDPATLEDRKTQATMWFRSLRNRICNTFEALETEVDPQTNACFTQKPWQRPGGGGGEMRSMKGRVFEKVGVNISTVYGEFSENFRKEIPGAVDDPRFWASGISVVAHPTSPHVPPVHMNTRMIIVGDGARIWFGGGADLNPIREVADDTEDFHAAFKAACDRHPMADYGAFRDACDDYFWIKHRNEPRGVGGIFYDYLDSGNWQGDFAFTQDVGETFLDIYPHLVQQRMYQPWTEAERHHQLMRRGRYAEFNLIYDRGTRFGLMTGGNPEAILMSLPPLVVWE